MIGIPLFYKCHWFENRWINWTQWNAGEFIYIYPLTIIWGTGLKLTNHLLNFPTNNYFNLERMNGLNLQCSLPPPHLLFIDHTLTTNVPNGCGLSPIFCFNSSFNNPRLVQSDAQLMKNSPQMMPSFVRNYENQSFNGKEIGLHSKGCPVNLINSIV